MLMVALSAAVCAGGCAASGDPDPGTGEGGADASDASIMDASIPDARGDAGPADARVDIPVVESRTCEPCETSDDCIQGFCINLTVGGKACVPGCVPDLPSCPRGFNCVLDIGSGVDTTVCVPVGGACCVDEDADMYGLGVGCLGEDCDDLNDTINPGATEVCNGIDDDCDMMADDPPTDCGSGRCTLVSGGTYSSVMGANCQAAMCLEGTTVACDQFTCVDGGENGNVCATLCNPMGMDDELYCIESAHCDDGGCLPDEPDGGMCDEDSDCISGHCENGFCCSGGTCCNIDSDCPGGGGVTRLCDTPMTCQGTRGEASCVGFVCQTMMGIPDDTECDNTVQALDCGLYDPVFCDGTVDQTPPTCPTSCVADGECIEAAHCEAGFCVPDRPPGLSCTRNQDCQAGLTCVDGVCCTTACNGTCEACNLPGAAGTCIPVPAMADPAGECPGFSCDNFYDGFGGGGDACFRRQPVSDATASCNGAGACISPATLCPLQPRGAPQIDCDDACQSPVAGTCTGMMPGMCSNLDNPMDQVSCGVGACARSVQRCVGGAAQMCTPGAPTAETCDGIDQNCNGVADDGPPSSLCPPPGGAATVACTAGSCRIDSCMGGTFDVDGVYTNGCECADDTSGPNCGAPLNLGPVTSGSVAHSGALMPGQTDWFRVSFPFSGRPGGGTPRITVAPMATFRLDVRSTCSASNRIRCSVEMTDSVNITDFEFTDNASIPGPRRFSGMHTDPWPEDVFFQVTRTAPAMVCGETAYTVTVTR
ncbi:MAG: putative metal-binding motif-containing protein [Myxococcota bacterium]